MTWASFQQGGHRVFFAEGIASVSRNRHLGSLAWFETIACDSAIESKSHW
jgi:hypothetical protein